MLNQALKRLKLIIIKIFIPQNLNYNNKLEYGSEL